MYYIWGTFFCFDNDSVFAKGTNEKACLLRGTMVMGMPKTYKETVKMLSTDISIILGVNLYWKDLQAFNTHKKIALCSNQDSGNAYTGDAHQPHGEEGE